MCACVCVCLPYEQCVSVLQCQGACLWFYEGGVHAQMCLCLLAADALTDTHTHTHTHTHTYTQTHTVVRVHWLRKKIVESLIWFQCFGGGWGVSGHSHSWFCQVELRLPSMLADSSESGRFMHVETLFTFLSEFSLALSPFSDLFRTSNRRTQRITNWFPGNFLRGSYLVKLFF